MKGKTGLRIFFRLLAYTTRHKTALCLAGLLGLTGVVVELARPWPVKIVVDHALGGRPLPPWLAALVAQLPGAGTPRGLLVWSVGAALAIAVGGGALSLLSLSIGLRVCQRLVLDLLLDLFVKLQKLSLRFHSRHKIGDLLQRVSGDVLVVFFAVTQVALPFVVSSLTLVGMFLIMLRLDAGLSLVALSVIPLLIVSLLLFARPLKASSGRNWKSQGALMALVEQSLSGIKVIQGFARESYMRRKVEAEAITLVEAGRRAALVTAGNNQAATAITGAAAVLMLYLGALRVMDGRLSIGDLLVFIGYLTALYGPVSALGTAVGYGIAVVTRSRRVFQILDSDEEVPERADAIVLQRTRGEVIFEDVSFGYGDNAERRLILRNVSFQSTTRTSHGHCWSNRRR